MFKKGDLVYYKMATIYEIERTEGDKSSVKKIVGDNKSFECSNDLLSLYPFQKGMRFVMASKDYRVDAVSIKGVNRVISLKDAEGHIKIKMES